MTNQPNNEVESGSLLFEVEGQAIEVPIASIASRMRDDFEDRYGTASEDDDDQD